MNKFSIFAFAIASLSSTAYAQDTSFSWTGPYVGAHAGYFIGKPHYMEPGFPDYDINPKLDGFTGGGLMGFNFETSGMVVGIDADAGVVGAKKGADLTATFNDHTAFDFDWNAHIRARAGVPIGASGKTLLYVAGGVAMAGLKVDDTDPGWDQSSKTHIGWTIGAGAEHAFSDTMTLRLEYLYDDYGTKSHTFTDGIDPYAASWHPKASTFRSAVSIKF
jgi:outer membrane immunogenic protein